MPSSKFVWQADNEPEWVEPQTLPVADKPAKPSRLVKFGILITITFTIALATYVLIYKRIDKAVQQTETEIWKVHVLLLEAIEARDYELFETLLAEKRSSWAESQKELLQLDLLWGRSSLGLEPGTLGNLEDCAAEVVLDPEMKRAEVRQTRQFVVSADSGISSTVNLQRTFLYQYNDSCWQLVPIEEDDSFWGGWESRVGKKLTLIYPERDATSGRRLAKELDQLITDLCDEQELRCPSDFMLELKLDKYADSLLQLGEGYYSVQLPHEKGHYALILPAPTLVGMPLDEVGYQALFRGYASWLGAILFNNLATAHSRAEQTLAEELLAKHHLELPPWPKAKTALKDSAARAKIKALPHDILMLCSSPNRRRLLRYQTVNGNWVDEWSFRSAITSRSTADQVQPGLWRLPDYSGALVSVPKKEAEGVYWQTYLWRYGKNQLWFEHEDRAYYRHVAIPIPLGPNEQVLVGYYLYTDQEKIIDPWYVDIQACLKGSCRQMAMDGIPQWSRDGQRTLLVELAPYEKPKLHLGDQLGHSKHVLGRALPISWIGDEQFVYLRRQVSGMGDQADLGGWQELILSHAKPGAESNPSAPVLVDTNRLQDSLGQFGHTTQLGIVHAVTYLDGWLIAARGYGREEQPSSYLFWFRPQSDELALLLQLDKERIMPPLHLNEDGHFLVAPAMSGEDYVLRILNLENGDVQFSSASYPYDWSADGQWLLFVEDRQLRVLAPALDYDWRIEHNLPNCDSAVWIDGT